MHFVLYSTFCVCFAPLGWHIHFLWGEQTFILSHRDLWVETGGGSARSSKVMLLQRNKESLLGWAKVCIDCSHLAGVAFIFGNWQELKLLNTAPSQARRGITSCSAVKCGLGAPSSVFRQWVRLGAQWPCNRSTVIWEIASGRSRLPPAVSPGHSVSHFLLNPKTTWPQPLLCYSIVDIFKLRRRKRELM